MQNMQQVPQQNMRSQGNPNPDLNRDIDVDIGEDGKIRKIVKYILVISSILGILSAVLIFSRLLNLSFSSVIPLELEHLGIIAGICAFICGFYTIIELIKKRKQI